MERRPIIPGTPVTDPATHPSGGRRREAHGQTGPTVEEFQMRTLKTGWWLFRRCADVCSRVNAYADRLAAIAAYVARRK